MAIDLYYYPLSPRCRAVLMTIKQLSIDVNIVNIDLNECNENTQRFNKLNPAYCVPTIVDGDFILWECRAIMQYLVNSYAPNSPLYLTDPNKRAIIDRTLKTEQSMSDAIQYALSLKVMRGIEPTEQQIIDYKNSLKLMDALIADHKYVCGDELTIADIAVLASISTLLFNEYKDLDDCPKLKTWFERLSKELSYFDDVNGRIAQDLKEAINLNKNKISYYFDRK